MKKIAIFGSTGSIGVSALSVVKNLKEQVQVTALSAHSNIDKLQRQMEEFNVSLAAVYDEQKGMELATRMGSKAKILVGRDGLVELAAHSCFEFAVMAIVGMQALAPTLAAIMAKKAIGLANKEVLVAAGEIVTKLAKEHNVSLIPIDSEHSALFQCIKNEKKEQIRRIILTASGGPFRLYSAEQLSNITVAQALNHPKWKMGPKVTIDSSTLMNKGLEMIEAYWLFEVSPEQIEVIIHPQSIIHSLVEYIDGSMLAQMSMPDMVLPIQYAITYPERRSGLLEPFDFIKNSRLEFFKPNTSLFPAIECAYESIRKGGSFPCFMNASNEVLVERFLREEISWRQISSKLEALLNKHSIFYPKNLDDLLQVDKEARLQAQII